MVRQPHPLRGPHPIQALVLKGISPQQVTSQFSTDLSTQYPRLLLPMSWGCSVAGWLEGPRGCSWSGYAYSQGSCSPGLRRILPEARGGPATLPEVPWHSVPLPRPPGKQQQGLKPLHTPLSLHTPNTTWAALSRLFRTTETYRVPDSRCPQLGSSLCSPTPRVPSQLWTHPPCLGIS